MEKLIANTDSSTPQELYTPQSQSEHKCEAQTIEETSNNTPQTVDEIDMYFEKNVEDVMDEVKSGHIADTNGDKHNEQIPGLDLIGEDLGSEKSLDMLSYVIEQNTMEVNVVDNVSDGINIEKEVRIPGLDLIDMDEEIPELDFNAEEEIVIEDDDTETVLNEATGEEVIEDDDIETVLFEDDEDTVIEDTVFKEYEEEIVVEDNDEDEEANEDGNTETVLNEDEQVDDEIKTIHLNAGLELDEENEVNNMDANIFKPICEQESVNDEDVNDEYVNDEDVNDEDVIDEDVIDEDVIDEDVNDEDVNDEDVNDEDVNYEDVNDKDDSLSLDSTKTKEPIPGLDLIEEHDLEANEQTAVVNLNCEEETTEKMEIVQSNEDIPGLNLNEEEELANEEVILSDQEITDIVYGNQEIGLEELATKSDVEIKEVIISKQIPQEVEAEFYEDCKPNEAMNECKNITENEENTKEFDKESTENVLKSQQTKVDQKEAKQLIELKLHVVKPKKPDAAACDSKLPTTPATKSTSKPLSTSPTSQEEYTNTPKLPKRTMRGIQIIEDIRLPIKMDIKYMSASVDEHKNKEKLSELPLPDISVGQIVTVPKLTADIPIVLYVQPDSTKIVQNDDEDAVLEAVMNELISEKPQPAELNQSYPNLSLETNTIEMALEQLHHQSHDDDQPDETTVSSTSLKGHHNPTPDLIKTLTQTPLQQQIALEKSRRGPSKVRIRIRSMNTCAAKEKITPNSEQKSPEKREKTSHKKRKTHVNEKREKPKTQVTAPVASVVPETPPDDPITIESPPQHVTLDETPITESSPNQSSDTSIVIKRYSMGNSDYQYERINDEVILRVTRRPRRPRPAAVESVTGDTQEK